MKEKLKNVIMVVTVAVVSVAVSVITNFKIQVVENGENQISKVRYQVVENGENQISKELEEQLENVTFGMEPKDATFVAANNSFRVFEDENGYLIIQTIGRHLIKVEGNFVKFGSNGNTGLDTLTFEDKNGEHSISINPYFDYGIDLNGYENEAIKY